MNDTLLTSLIALGGVIVGTILTSINNQRIKSKEAKLRILEKVFDKRIEAHEQILMVVKQIRSVTSTDVTDEHSNVISYPNAMQSQQDLGSFMNHTFSIIHMNTHALAKHEVGKRTKFLSRLYGFFKSKSLPMF